MRTMVPFVADAREERQEGRCLHRLLNDKTGRYEDALIVKRETAYYSDGQVRVGEARYTVRFSSDMGQV